jgi:hypothetical protein
VFRAQFVPHVVLAVVSHGRSEAHIWRLDALIKTAGVSQIFHIPS